MKSIFNLSTLLILFCTVQIGWANKVLIDKEKVIEKTYSISNEDEISLDNQFGEIIIEHHNSNTIEIKVVVTASSTSDTKAQKILDAIEVKHGQSNGDVSVRTLIDKKSNITNNNDKNYKKQGFEINYLIKMPNQNALEVKNAFGDIRLDDHDGPVEINLQFGSLEANNLKEVSQLEIQFSDAEVRFAQIDKVDIQFSKIELENITGAFDGSFSFCEKAHLNFDSDTKDVYIKADHSTLDITLPNNYSGDFDISTSFGKFHNDIGIKDVTRKSDYGPNFDHEYQGTTGSGQYDFRIKSSFSKINLE